METTQLKRFATEARQLLRQGVINKIALLGFNEDGEVEEGLTSVLVQGATNFGGRIIEGETFYHQWMALRQAVSDQGIRQVYEEAAYTWFNRFIAIRILQKNGIIEPVLDFADESRTPQLVKNAQMGILPMGMAERAQRRLNMLLNDPNKVTEQFAILITAFCHATPLIDRIFGRLDDYTELLLPDNILAPDGFLDRLNHTPYITEEDYRHTELIGWLYQFYISERKDEVFASFQKGRKAEAEDIPAATQIFTPNWIVKYMVENTLGRIYLDHNPDAPFKDEMRYLVDECPMPDGEVKPVLQFDSPEELKCADLSCGSGHILTEFFDLLLKIYDAEWYDPHDAIENIFRNNLTGIDIDTRAKQLSVFALMLKACQIDKSFADAHILPKVYDIPRVPDVSDLDEYLPHFFLGGNKKVIKETKAALELMKQASNLGSIMKFEISEETREAILEAVARWKEPPFAKAHQAILPCFDLMLALTDKYAAVVMNPPYLGSGRFDATLSKYVKNNYTRSKADLFAIFMDVAIDSLADNGKYGMINMQNWMFIVSYQKLRNHLIANYKFDSMVHLGPGLFDELDGEVVQSTMFIISNNHPSEKTGATYYRLIDGIDCFAKEHMFLSHQREFLNVKQNSFYRIPGEPIVYWASDVLANSFSNVQINSLIPVKKGMDTGDNEIYLRIWFELSINKIGFYQNSNEEFDANHFKWAPYNKGGKPQRKWFGLNQIVVLWENSGEELKLSTANIRSQHLYFKKCITWNALATDKTTARISDYGALFDSAGSSMFPEDSMIYYLLGFMNSVCVHNLLYLLNPTMNYGAGSVGALPLIKNESAIIDSLVIKNIDITKKDWNSHETSWDFEQSPLLAIQQEMKAQGAFGGNLLKNLVDEFIEKWEGNFIQLHKNEEELNRQFIEIYGLQNELTPDVPLDEITILQQGEITIENDKLKWNADVLIKQFISYAVGCMMGRYRLDKKGLNIAHHNATEDETSAYEVNGETFVIDDEAIIPLMPEHSCFTDNAVTRMKEFLRITLGEKNHKSNLNYIQECLGKSLEEYFRKDFWREHKKRYQNRPIYWLFSSKKGAFQCIAYMHRMTPFTCNQVRNYLLRYIEFLQQQISATMQREATLNASERRQLDKMQKGLAECQEYDLRLHDVALRQIAFDLDDGVVKNYALFGNVLAKLK